MNTEALTARYRTTRDLVIPAGTELGSPPVASTRWGKDYEAVIGIDRDHSGYFSMDLKEGLGAGFIERVTE